MFHQGTQIEPARQEQSYEDYGKAEGPMVYLDKTRYWVSKFAEAREMAAATADEANTENGDCSPEGNSGVET